MTRRDFLKGATLVAGANAAAAFATSPQEQPAPDTTKGKPLGKIALEEHFMVPDFVEYFAEIYPNISPEIAKLGLRVLPDLGDKRIAITDQNGIDFVVLSLAGPGVQVEKGVAIALRKS
jgi:2,3-dihydroxybenzoate decarboxylase